MKKQFLSKSIPNVDKMMPSVEIEKYEGEKDEKKSETGEESTKRHLKARGF